MTATFPVTILVTDLPSIPTGIVIPHTEGLWAAKPVRATPEAIAFIEDPNPSRKGLAGEPTNFLVLSKIREEQEDAQGRADAPPNNVTTKENHRC